MVESLLNFMLKEIVGPQAWKTLIRNVAIVIYTALKPPSTDSSLLIMAKCL